ncbi:STN domain-containing protein [Acidovorax sp. SDU_ACID1]|uniref:STN domain-containing protein n=1 Tax=Acidovorax sp. SDU_ACID1 TaxID=3136632 RepID=UPI0038736AC0
MSRHQTHHRSTSAQPLRFVLRLMVLAVHLAMVGGIVFGAGWADQAHAQQAAPAAGGQAGATTGQRTYDIPAGPLNTVLVRFLAESGVLLSGSTELARGKNSPGVKGRYTPRTALAALLAGTGLEAKADAQGYYELRTAAVVSAPSTSADPPTLPPSGSSAKPSRVRVQSRATQRNAARQAQKPTRPSLKPRSR